MSEENLGEYIPVYEKMYSFRLSRHRGSGVREFILIASPAAVASSSIEQLDMGKPLRDEIIVWKLIRASRRPWDISA